MSDFKFSEHSKSEMTLRNISEDSIQTVLNSPEQIVDGYDGKKIYQSRIMVNSKEFLLRVVVGTATEPKTVVTLYKTSNVKKYWELK